MCTYRIWHSARHVAGLHRTPPVITFPVTIIIKWEKEVGKSKPMAEEGPLWIISESFRKRFKNIWFSLDEQIVFVKRLWLRGIIRIMRMAAGDREGQGSMRWGRMTPTAVMCTPVP